MSLLRLLVEHPFDDGEPLVHTLDVSLTKAEVVARVEAQAAQLHDKAGQLIPIVADGVDALIAMFACWRAGAVYVPINPRQPQVIIDDTVRSMSSLAPPPGSA
ncbi:MAG: amino acid adenylation domain-containing protein, partial [Acidimicrobiaceae bacterium]|nr:amino acid adenylation domain-containing protein [Acidimicrobiaceae bacterium]